MDYLLIRFENVGSRIVCFSTQTSSRVIKNSPRSKAYGKVTIEKMQVVTSGVNIFMNAVQDSMVIWAAGNCHLWQMKKILSMFAKLCEVIDERVWCKWKQKYQSEIFTCCSQTSSHALPLSTLVSKIANSWWPSSTIWQFWSMHHYSLDLKLPNFLCIL
jgi:hypothetical protein